MTTSLLCPLDQGSTNFFCKRAERNYFSLCRLKGKTENITSKTRENKFCQIFIDKIKSNNLV